MWNSVGIVLFQSCCMETGSPACVCRMFTQVRRQNSFVSVGRIPATGLFQEELNLNDAGYLQADESTRTNLRGVFAVGDVRAKALHQIVTAVADGAVAIHYAEEVLAEDSRPESL